MPKKLFVSILRLIRETKGRFLSISVIVALGVAFFVGVTSSASVMSESVDYYDDETGLKDITVYSDYGFDDEDVAAVRELDHVREAEGTWFTDVIASCGKDTAVTRIHGYTDGQKINRFILKEGRMPRRPDEVLAECGSDLQQGFQIGSTVKLQTADGEKNENLKYDEVIVVGSIDTPLYLNETKENSTLSNRYIETYLYIPADAFDIDYYTELNILLEDAAEMDSFSETYSDYAGQNREAIELIADTLKDRRYEKIRGEAEEKYNDGLKEYEDGENTYNREIGEAEMEIADAEAELEDGRKKIDDGRRELTDAEKELAETEEEQLHVIQEANEQIDANEKELLVQKKKAEEGRREAESGLDQIREGNRQINDALNKLYAAQDGLDQIDEGIALIDENLELLRTLTGRLEKISDQGLIRDLAEEMPELAAAGKQLNLGEEATVKNLKEAVKDASAAADEQEAALKEQKDNLIQMLKDQGFSSEDPVKEAEDALVMTEDGLRQAEEGLAQIGEASANITSMTDEMVKAAEFLDSYDALVQEIDYASSAAEGILDQISAMDDELPLSAFAEAVPSAAGIISGAGLSEENTVGELRSFLHGQTEELAQKKQTLVSQRDEILQTLNAQGFSSPEEALDELNAQKAALEEKAAEAEAAADHLREIKSGLESLLDGLKQIDEGLTMIAGNRGMLSALQEGLRFLGDDALLKDLAEADPSLAEAISLFGLKEEDTVLRLREAAEAEITSLNTTRQELAENRETILVSVRETGYDSPAEAIRALKAQKGELSGKQKEALEALTLLDDADKKIAEGEAQIREARRQTEDGLRILKEEIAEAQKKIREGWQTLSENEEKLKEGEQELSDGRQELEDARREGREELNEAWAELADARKEIDELEPNHWTVLDRSSHYASATYDGTIDQMASIGRVFPVFFILVAALVCLTTMTRMVDEQRGEIGILRALGYTRMQCAAKYLIYAGAATALGTLAGTVGGMLSFPVIIYHTWRMMYILPPIRMTVPWGLIVTTALVFLFAMLAATWAACGNDLREVPAQLLRPKAPKLGRSMFLEKIGFIWNRLSFTWKVTLRNIFRYRSRFIMTVAGVAGCTALLLTGYGIRDSINSMVDIQFFDIYRFDGSAVLAEDTPEEKAEQVFAELEQTEGIASVGRSYTYTAKGYGEGALSETMTVLIYSDPSAAYSDFSLRTRIGQNPVSLSDDGVVINEKLAENLGASVGDTFRMEDQEGKLHTVKIAALTEMYIRHYVLMTDTYYRSLTDSPLSRICFHIRLAEDAPEDIQERIAAADGVDTIEFFDTLLENFRTMVKSLDIIVWTLIISSMSLAAVVLGNLINVNISERQREIATLKVLGFRRGEVRSYIYKENNILTLIGAAAGMPLGTLLHHYIMRTVEMDYIMFGRDVLPMSYLISGALTILFGIIVNHMMASRLDRIKMVESLKSVE